MPLCRFVSFLSLLMLLAMPAAGAQAPESVDGELVVVPVLDAGSISLDGDLGDWATLPAFVTTDGPLPSADPATTGQLRWQVAASEQVLYVAATITDENIVAGRNGDNYWNEDSIEIYLNFADLTATSYGDGIGQVTISAVDRGNSDPEALSLSGLGAPQFPTSGFVFATTAGWGFEVAIDLDGIAQIADGAEFGIQMQANGSSGGDRDLKISWSNADVSDTSYQDPSVFGKGVFLGGPAIDAVAEPDDEPAEAAVEDTAIDDTAADAATETVSEVVETDAATDNESEGDQTLLIAAVVSAASILIGGLWFERRRKKSEAALAAAAAGTEAGVGDKPDQTRDGDDLSTDDFDSMVNSILDEE